MNKKGFTLIEVIAVISILSLVFIVAIPKVNDYIKSRKNDTFITNARNISRQLEYDNLEYKTFEKTTLLDLNITGISQDDFDLSLSVAYVIEDEIYIDLVGKGKYKDMYICGANHNKKDITIQNELCSTNIEEFVYINFDVNLVGGSTSQQFESKYLSGKYIELENPTKDGYVFNGWYVERGNSTIEGNRIKIGTEDTVIRAMWANKIVLTIDLNGGTSSTNQSGSYNSGTDIELAEPKKQGYKFVKWEIIEGNGILSGNILTIGTENVLIKAIWELNVFSLTVDANGGNITQEFKSEYAAGEKITLEIPSKTGYTFAGWTTDNGSINEDIFTMGTSNAVLTANWEANTYDISYELYGGTNASGNPTSGTYGSTKIVNNPTRTGYTFAGWSVSGTGALLSGTNLTIGTENIILTANWTPNTYYFDVNVVNADGAQPWENCEAGTFEMSVNGGAYTRVCNESGEHYPYGTVINFRNFSPGSGRYLSNVTGATNSGDVWTVTITGENVVEFKTGWNTYSISYNLNGGTNASDNPIVGTFGNTVTVNNPTRGGYTFAGWTLSGTGALLSGTNLTIGTGNVILTANWTPNSYTITFNANGGSFDSIYTAVGQSAYSVPITGSYKLEVWGAQGGTYNTTYSGGYGGYSVGTISLNSGTTLYVNVGGAGSVCGGKDCTVNGGYNGGGAGRGFSACGSGVYAGSGGGATHISTVSGQLSSLSQYAGNNSSPILIVAGGGGAGNYCNGSNYAKGGSGGGITGVTSVNLGASDFAANGGSNATGGTQSSGYSFGLGGGSTSDSNGSVGGGGGYYGGRNSTINGAGGGSGYIANNSLTSKAMYCYSCSTSSTASTLTYSTTNVSSTPTANYAKSGSGAAKITMLSNSKTVTNTSTYGSLPTPTRTNYTFVGWNTKSDGTGTTISSSSTVNLSGNITLYAKWGKPIEVGDYVSYTPSSKSYTTSTGSTGYSSTQTINPSELNLWRILKINSDGSMDIISHYVSSTAVYFHGNVGYNNYVSYLNTLASQYQTSGITTGSRHFGSDYPGDYNLVNSVLGTRVAYGVNATSTAKDYWMAKVYGTTSWSENYQSATLYNVLRVTSAGAENNTSFFQYYCYYGECSYEYWSNAYPIRPIVTLKAGLTFTGDGSNSSPWKIAS